MIRNYFLTAWRNLKTQRLTSLINITGLAISLAACMTILLYVQHERSYDGFHVNAPRIVEVGATVQMGDEDVSQYGLSYLSATSVKQYIPQVETAVRLDQDSWVPPIISTTSGTITKWAEKQFFYADSDFLKVFSFPLLQGDRNSCLREPFSVLITEGTARRYFGNTNPIGKTVSYNGKYAFRVTGVFAAIPSNSSLRFDFLASMSSEKGMPEKAGNLDYAHFGSGVFATYLLLKPDFSAANAQKALVRVQALKESQEGRPDKMIVTPLRDIHLSPGNASEANVKYITYFPIIALLILALALTNYVSLSTSKSSLRAKEIGVRKTMGAGRRSIAFQFVLETALFTSIAFVFGYMLCYIFHNRFLQFLDLSIDPGFLYSGRLLGSFATLYLITIFLASVYPALLLSAFKPVQVLSGKLGHQPGAMQIRRFITVFQFGISAALIICGIVVNRQVSFFRNTDTGVSREDVLMVPFPESLGKHFVPFRTDLSRLTGVEKLAANHYELYGSYDLWSVKMADDPGMNDPNKMKQLSMFNVDQNYISLLNLRWATAPDNISSIQKKDAIVLNESAVNALHLIPGKLHQQVLINGTASKDLTGILKDFNFESLERPIAAMGLAVSPDSSEVWQNMKGAILVRIAPNVNRPSLIANIKRIYEKYDQTTPFSFSFVDEAYDRMYRAEERLSEMFVAFIGIAIAVACLGLFGLVTFTASQRVKEIGIRKVLGASVGQIMRLLAGDFVKLILVGWMVAVPVTWMVMSRWLNQFAYRIPFRWWMPVSAGLLILFLAMLTVGTQSYQTATANPAESLKAD